MSWVRVPTESDTGGTRSTSARPFTRSQARELQKLQALFMQMAVCELVSQPPKDLNVFKCEVGP